MDSFYRPTWAEISLDAIAHNFGVFRNLLPKSMNIMAVVKANAYGHGAIQVAQKVLNCGADYLGVAFLDEALELRHAGIRSPILVLGFTSLEGLSLAIDHDVTLTVYDHEILDEISRITEVRRRKANESGIQLQPVKIHVKIDSGMGRIGLHEEQAAIVFIEKALQMEGVQVEGIFTHYARADEVESEYTLEQYRKFERIIRHFQTKNISFPYVHAGNSATGVHYPELSYNMLRLGISLYGLYPDEKVDRSQVQLIPAMSYKTKVVMVKSLPPGSG